ncbi:hypothetical protein [Neorickettsia sennetsu]|uniref:Uncharacterized protein n=1 Tax=Ehrlichia sennetsu (strain ATCC VR-367 / Miyayama) TaxID=222891 RepID=Q2GDQ8_EHRS3|nr:hypothetical protein [Neorickettsia sennetsu]ABD45667.1 hypothetical protein NSE_0504 [Neorickettsia sennetsu str. Miyayama]
MEQYVGNEVQLALEESLTRIVGFYEDGFVAPLYMIQTVEPGEQCHMIFRTSNGNEIVIELTEEELEEIARNGGKCSTKIYSIF